MEGADGRPQGIAYWAAACLKNQEQSTRAEVKDNFQAVRLGINHKFGGPVVVKYGSAFSSAVQEPRIVRGQAFLCLEDQS